MKLHELKQNDPVGATAVYRAAVLDGTWTPELSTILIQMLDKPSALRAFEKATDKLEKAPSFAKKLAKLVGGVSEPSEIDLGSAEIKTDAKIKSNARMPARTRANIDAMLALIAELEEPNLGLAQAFVKRATPTGAFEILHSIRRWYSGQTMGRRLLKYRPVLRSPRGPMDLEPDDVIGAYRGFRVATDDPIAASEEGSTITLDVDRNHGLSSWSTSEAPTNKFSGASSGVVGMIVRLSSSAGVVPILAPPERTAAWFNELYRHVIGDAYRMTEAEYLISATSVVVEVVRVKR